MALFPCALDPTGSLSAGCQAEVLLDGGGRWCAGAYGVPVYLGHSREHGLVESPATFALLAHRYFSAVRGSRPPFGIGLAINTTVTVEGCHRHAQVLNESDDPTKWYATEARGGDRVAVVLGDYP